MEQGKCALDRKCNKASVKSILLYVGDILEFIIEMWRFVGRMLKIGPILSKKWRTHKFVARNVVNFMGHFPKTLWTMLLGPKVFGNMTKNCHQKKNHCSRVKKM